MIPKKNAQSITMVGTALRAVLGFRPRRAQFRWNSGRLGTAIPTVVFVALAAAPFVSADVNNPSTAERFAKPSDDLVARENKYWARTPLSAPDDIVLETSGILALPGKRLIVTTRRGEVWIIDGAYDTGQNPTFTLFASGLHEPLGIVAAPKGGYYVAQRQEVTRIADTDGDGRADLFETVCKFPISGAYHEYAFGPVLAPNGNMRVTLNVAFGGATQSPVPWRGWMVEITPDGQMIPIAGGLRSPCGFTVTSQGVWLYAENQGEWAGSGRVTEVEPGDFMGHPAGLAWSKLPGSTVKLRPEDILDFEKPYVEVAKILPGLKLPTVWLPHTILGISNSGIAEDTTGGKFGPFAGQLFVGDQGQSKIMRLTLEKIKGVWQGAAYAFREGFDCGIIRLSWGEDGSLFAGETARGWGSNGPKQQGLERLAWTGAVPFEVKEVRAQPDGFVLTFTRPVDRATAEKAESYAIAGFTYLYHEAYGSAPVNRLGCPIRKVVVAPDGLSVRLAGACLREGYIHEIRSPGVRAAQGGEALLHATAYYTLNQIPDGERIIARDPKDAELCVAPVPAAANAATKKHPIKAPPDWNGDDGDKTILLGTLPGLKFDTAELSVKARAHVRLVFRNPDDMLHNFVLCAPGRGQAVGTAALALGLEGAEKNYVPETDDVLYHTALTQPGTSDTIFFTAPALPGDYDFICSFPGHAVSMKGVLHVTGG